MLVKKFGISEVFSQEKTRISRMFVHKNTRAQFAQHAAQIRDSSTEEEEEEGDLLQVIIIKIKKITKF